MAKLFLVDLRHLGGWQRIASYFALGACLVAISFVYQHFIKKLEIRYRPASEGEKEV